MPQEGEHRLALAEAINYLTPGEFAARYVNAGPRQYGDVTHVERNDPIERALAEAESPNRPDPVIERIKWKAAAPHGMQALGEEYRLEKKHPRHPMGHYLAGFYSEWQRTSRATDFFGWLNSLGPADVQRVADKNGLSRDELNNFMRGVAYLNAAGRQPYRCLIVSGRIQWRGKALDTRDMNVGCGGGLERGMAIWVMSPQNVFYTASHDVGVFHHSSFLAGGFVRAAGEWAVDNGQVKYINNQTGHYMCSTQQLANAAGFLKQHNLFRPGAKIDPYAEGSFTVDAFLARFRPGPEAPDQRRMIGAHRGPHISIGDHRRR